MSHHDPDEVVPRTCDPNRLPAGHAAQGAGDVPLPRWLELANLYEKERVRAGGRVSPPLSTMAPTVADVDRPLAEHATALGRQVVVRRILGPMMQRVPSIAVEPVVEAPNSGGIVFSGNPFGWLRRLMFWRRGE